MVLGAVLFVVGLTMRAGLLRPTVAAVGPVPSITPAAVVAAAPTPPASSEPAASPDAPSEPTPAPTPEPTPAPTAELIFADEFDAEAAWPVGAVTGMTTRYDAEGYVLDAPPSDLPFYVEAVSGDGSLPTVVTAEATLRLDGTGEGQAGLFVVDRDGARVGVLVAPDGRVILVRDSIESFDVLGTGSLDVGEGPIRLSLTVSPSGTTALVDGQAVASIREYVVPAGWGLVIWSQLSPTSVFVDRYEVRSAPSS